MFRVLSIAVLGAFALVTAHAQGEPPLVKRFPAGKVTMLQTRDGRMWSPLLDKVASDALPSDSRYFGAVKAQSATGGEILVVTTLYLPTTTTAGAKSFEETFEVQCEANKLRRTASVGFSGEYLTGTRVASAAAAALTEPESAWLIAQACAARDFQLQYSQSDPFK
jgi:hypothetical protein